MFEKLPPRERELFEALCARGEATDAELEAAIADPPSNSAIRAMLSRMEKKGFVTHRVVDQKYVYRSAVPEQNLKQSALRRIIQTFGSPVGAATALLGMSERIEAHELDELEALIAKARKEQGE